MSGWNWITIEGAAELAGPDDTMLGSAAKGSPTLLALEPAPLTVGPGPDERVVGICQHVAVLTCALPR